MKGRFLREIGAILAIVLAVAVIFSDYNRQRITETEKGAPALEVTQRVLLSRIKNARMPLVDIQRQMREAQWLLEDIQKQKETYSIEEAGGGKSIFTNKVDGYRVLVPEGMKADMSCSGVRAVLEKEDLKLEIYRQEIPDAEGSGIETYTNYSNRFLDNKADHRRELEGKIDINGRTAYFLQWSRNALAKVENDKCHYACVEVPLSEREVITFLFKSSKPFENKSYLDVVKSFETIDKTAQPYTRKIRLTENTGWDPQTAKAFEYYFGEEAPLRWGIFEAGAPLDFTELKKIETRLDFTFPVLL